MAEGAFYIRRIWSFSRAVDLALVDEEVERGFDMPLGQRHGERVGYMAMRLGKQLNLPKKELLQLVIVGLLHDIGAVGGFRRFHGDHRLMEEHCILGSMMLERFPEGAELGKILLYHHETPLSHHSDLELPPEGVPLLSKIISFVDKVDVRLLRKHYSRDERQKIIQWVHEFSGKTFFPELVPAFTAMAEREAFWLDLEEPDLMSVILGLLFDDWMLQSACSECDPFTDELVSLFADLIDQKSEFTMNHSRTVADCAMAIANKMGWNKKDQHDIFTAGLVHDLGKLAVPKKVLDKNGPLDKDEIAIIRTHTYYTHRLLTQAGFERHIAQWAAHHHERLDGKGYPFGLKAESLDQGSRIMTISDIFAALTEDRPYRKAMTPGEAFDILRKGEGKSVDENILRIAEKALG